MNDDSQGRQALTPGLYVIATPIGNLGDITFRAAEFLGRVDLIACEDTRVTRKLLGHLQIRTKLTSYHEHSHSRVSDMLMSTLRSGGSIALVSDAGTPCIADPGYKLVRAATEEGIAVFSVPGPSSVIAALSISGLPTDRHYFDGFLPSRRSERQRRLVSLASIDATLVFLEAPHRTLECLKDMMEVLGDRNAALAREITKRFEEVVRGRISEIVACVSQWPTIKGEIVLLVERPAAVETIEQVDLDRAIEAALKLDKPSRAAAQVARQTGIDKERIYKRILELKRP